MTKNSYAVQSNNNNIHLLNFWDRTHFKVNLHDLLPIKFIESRRDRYNPLVIGYVREQKKENQVRDIPFVLKQLILKYYPVIQLKN